MPPKGNLQEKDGLTRSTSSNGRQRKTRRTKGKKGNKTRCEARIIDLGSADTGQYHWIHSVEFLLGGKHFVAGEFDGNIRRWRVEDAKEVRTPIRAGDALRAIAVSQDGKWITAATWGGDVNLWDVESGDKAPIEFNTTRSGASAVDISPDSTKIALATSLKVFIWSLSAGQQPLCWTHGSGIQTVRFSPDGSLLAASSRTGLGRGSLRIYDGQSGHLLANFELSISTRSLAWVSNSKQLFALSDDGNVHCLDVYSGMTLSKWSILGSGKPKYMSLSKNGAFIAACTNASVLFWDVYTQQQIGSVIPLSSEVSSMDISENHLVAVGGSKIALWDLCDFLPSPYVDCRPVSNQDVVDEAPDDVDEPSRINIYRTICEILEEDGCIREAIEFFRLTQGYALDMDVEDEHAQWELDFRCRCTKSLEKLADVAMNSLNYNEADELCSTILSLNPSDRMATLIKRSTAQAMMESWEGALKDADEAVELDPSSHRGYERRQAALHGEKRYAEAVAALDTMLSILERSTDARVRALRSRYIDARPIIRRIILATVAHMPRVLIDTTTGHLLDRAQQAEAFESLPIFTELVSSMTRDVDHAWIWREVKQFYQYVMLSHKWEHGEPLFQQVVHVTVYELDTSPANIKLQKFCSLAHALKFRWAWSDTCCIDKENNVVLQESLVAMFAWYRGSTLTVIYLCDVFSLLEEADGLRESIWNTRVWTYQEYVAAERVRFYTADWKPYLGLTLSNHKDSPAVLKEMEMSEVSAEQVAILRPGLDRVREKLYLASRRETTLVEDIAYSLLGIFKAPIPVIYGEDTRAVGRLLEYVLTGSGDAAVLAWTGTANDYHSCLPMNLTVYSPLVPPHIPYMETAELDRRVMELRASLPDVSLAATLCDQLNKLPSAILASSRLRLPCILIPVTTLTDTSGVDAETDLSIYRAATSMLGDVAIQTRSDLAVEREYCFVHPWIRPLLDQEYLRGTAGLDKMARVLRIVARLKQPFGALLLEKVSRVEYKRVASDSLIMVQIRSEVSLTDLIDNIEIVEVQ